MSIDFYFSDLTPTAQRRLLAAQGLSCAEDGNYDLDIVPLFTLDIEVEGNQNNGYNKT